MRFEDAYEGWTEKRLAQIDAARLLDVCPALFAAPSTPRQARGPPAPGLECEALLRPGISAKGVHAVIPG